MSFSLTAQVVASIAAMDFPNGNDAPNSSGCPNGTGTAPQPCAAPGEAGCIPHQTEFPTIRQAPPETIDGIVGRILKLEEPPDEIGPYSLAYHIKHDIVNPTRKWLANEPQVYLDAENNVRASSVHRDYSHEMAPVLGEIVLMVAPGTNAFARSKSVAPSGGTVARVGELRSAIPSAQHGRVTMGVGLAEDASGVQRILIGTSEPRGYLRPGVTLAPGETLAPGLGHAEVDIVNFAEQNGLRLLEVGATRPICPSCAAYIEGAGARSVTPLKVP